MVKCPKCGNENENRKYCDECGTKLSSDEDMINKLKNKIQTTNRNYLILGAVIIIIAIVAIAALTIFNGSNSEQINEVTFHIPDGYNLTDVDNDNDGGIGGKSVIKLYSNEEDKYIRIAVTDNKGVGAITEDSLLDFLYDMDANPTAKNIKGHEGYAITRLDGVKGFTYLENDKFVLIWSEDESLINGILP